MNSIRLTNELRNKICDNIMKFKFKNIHEELKKEEIEIGDVIYNTIVSEKEQKLMKQLPYYYFLWSDAIKGQYAEHYHATHYYEMSEKKPLPYENKWASYKKYPELCKKLQKFEHKKSEINEKETTIRKEINAVLQNVTTLKKLLEVWPEIKEFIPIIEGNTYTVPTIRLEDLNKKLNLKKEGE